MKKILISVGYKQRELNYLSILTLHLQKAGFQVRVRYVNYELYYELFSWQPDFFISGQVNQNENIEIAKYAHACGAQVLVLNCEGTYNTTQKIERFGDKVADYVTMLFAWGKQHFTDALANTDLLKSAIAITGTPKFDLYKKPLSDYFAQRLPYQNKIKKGKPTICIATSFAGAETEWEDVAHNNIYKKMGRELFELRKAAQVSLRTHFVNLAIALAQSKKYNIIFRVHPLEPQDYYKKVFSNHQEIIFDNKTLAVELFSVVNLLIYRSSSLAPEAWIAGVPTVCYDPVNNADKDMLEFTSLDKVLYTLKAVTLWVKNGGFNSKVVSKKRKEYILRWYGFSEATDELSSQKIVNVIQRISALDKHKPYHINLVIYSFISILRMILNKKYNYEVLAILKGNRYLKAMRELYITDADVEKTIKKYKFLFKGNS